MPLVILPQERSITTESTNDYSHLNTKPRIHVRLQVWITIHYSNILFHTLGNNRNLYPLQNKQLHQILHNLEKVPQSNPVLNVNHPLQNVSIARNRGLGAILKFVNHWRIRPRTRIKSKWRWLLISKTTSNFICQELKIHFQQ